MHPKKELSQVHESFLRNAVEKQSFSSFITSEFKKDLIAIKNEKNKRQLIAHMRKNNIKPIRFVSHTTKPKYKIVTTDEDINALRDYLSHKEKLERKHRSNVRITFP